MLLLLSTSNLAFIMCSSSRYNVASWIVSDSHEVRPCVDAIVRPGMTNVLCLGISTGGRRIAAMRQLRLGLNLEPPYLAYLPTLVYLSNRKDH